MSETSRATEISGVPAAFGPGIPNGSGTAPPNSSVAERAVLIGLIASSVALAAYLVADVMRYAM